MSILRLAIPSPLRRPFDYLPPAGMDASAVNALRPGQRMRVPFGTREVTGYLIGVFPQSGAPEGSLKRAGALLDDAPLIDATLFDLARWAADYYHHPCGEVFQALFPKRLRDGKAREPYGQRGWRLSARGKGLPAGAPARSPKQAGALALLRSRGAMTTDALVAEGISTAVMRALRDKSLIEACSIEVAASAAHCHTGLALNPEQATALKALQAAGSGFSCHLLEGVTGSGKTEVYLQLIADCLQRGRQALVLIPEIGLTPQTLGRFQARFDCHVVVLHSGLTDAQRYRAWEAARDGSAHIVIGTRSAVFTPLADTGLIVVDEEHDASYKQQDGFRYNARDIAVKRGQLANCPVLLGSATPSLESLHNALAGRYRHHR
ncbi:MAG: primosomal protein N', partial [Halioglobus sp.]